MHQLFTVDDVEFYRNKFPDIKIPAVHPECDPQCGGCSRLLRLYSTAHQICKRA
ncbi:MAG: quinolinate synthase NadA [Sulfurovum sp.]|nr:quinolinate synthase NadA [Sulfurovum sp.]